MEYTRRFDYLVKGFLGYLAYIAVIPLWLAPWLHRLRGTKIHDIRNVYIAPNVVIDSLFPELIEIEEDVYLTRGVKVISHFNPTDSIKKIIGMKSVCGRVLIKRGAFIGVNSIILPNVTIGYCAVVAAGSVVTRSVEDYSIVAGNPARPIGDIREYKPKY